MKDSGKIPAHILVVEDDSDFGYKLKRQIAKIATAVDIEECVDAAIETLKSKRYDLLVLDIWLPQSTSALSEKRELENSYDNLTRELIKLDANDPRKTKLRGQMEQKIAESRKKLQRRGGLMVIEALDNNVAPAAILFLTAIGNEDTCNEAEDAARRIGCFAFSYLVKPQSPEIVNAHIKALLNNK